MGLPAETDPTAPTYPTDPTSGTPSDGSGATGGGSPGRPTPANVSRTLQSVDQSGHTCTYRYSGSYSNNTDALSVTRRFRDYKDGTLVYNAGFGGGTQISASFNSGTPGDPTTIEADNSTYSWRTGLSTADYGNAWAEALFYKSAAVTAVANAPTAPTVGGGTLEPTQAYISATCYPNTLHSIATLQLQYKRSVDSTWTDFGTSATTSSYSIRTIGRQLTGITASTSYDVRLKITRTTVNETSVYSSTTTFVTPADTPTITTVAASSVGQTTARLNATLAIGNQSSVNVKWTWGTASDLAGGTLVSYVSNPVTASGNYQYVLTGLTASNTYYFRAEVYWNSDASSSTGSILSFATGAVVDEEAAAALEDHMLIYEFDRKYKTATTVFFSVVSPSGTSSNRFYNDVSPFAAGDITISVDGGSNWANIGTLPTRLGTTSVFSMPLTAAETTPTDGTSIILIQIVDQTASPAFRDALIIIRTEMQLGSIVVDSSQNTNKSAVVLTGAGSGHGLSAVGGATGQDINGVMAEMVLRTNTAAAGGASAVTLDSGATTTADFYNGAIIYIVSGTGAGQARVITDYSTGRVCTVHKAWSTNPSSDSVYVIMPGPDVWEIPNVEGELTAIPAVGATWSRLLTFLYQRFKFKRTQTATTHTMYKDDGSTSLGTAAVSDSAGTQTFNELA